VKVSRASTRGDIQSTYSSALNWRGGTWKRRARSRWSDTSGSPSGLLGGRRGIGGCLCGQLGLGLGRGRQRGLCWRLACSVGGRLLGDALGGLRGLLVLIRTVAAVFDIREEGEECVPRHLGVWLASLLRSESVGKDAIERANL
jgi:hypothetical protein